MTAHTFIVDVLLSITAASCWVGVLGMLRMREAMQTIHYLALPASIGMIMLTLAVFLETGFSTTALKTCLIAVILLGINSVVTHATARAFRTRQLGHWQPRDGDPMEFVSSKKSESNQEEV